MCNPVVRVEHVSCAGVIEQASVHCNATGMVQCTDGHPAYPFCHTHKRCVQCLLYHVGQQNVSATFQHTAALHYDKHEGQLPAVAVGGAAIRGGSRKAWVPAAELTCDCHPC